MAGPDRPPRCAYAHDTAAPAMDEPGAASVGLAVVMGSRTRRSDRLKRARAALVRLEVTHDHDGYLFAGRHMLTGLGAYGVQAVLRRLGVAIQIR